MSKLRQLIRLQTSHLSVRELSRALALSVGAVSKYLTAVRAAGLTAAAIESLSDAEIEARVFGPAEPAAPSRFAAIDFGWRAVLPAGRAYDGAGAHAGGPPRARELDAAAADRVGALDRAAAAGHSSARSRGSPAPGAPRSAGDVGPTS